MRRLHRPVYVIIVIALFAACIAFVYRYNFMHCSLACIVHGTHSALRSSVFWAKFSLYQNRNLGLYELHVSVCRYATRRISLYCNTIFAGILFLQVLVSVTLTYKKSEDDESTCLVSNNVHLITIYVINCHLVNEVMNMVIWLMCLWWFLHCIYSGQASTSRLQDRLAKIHLQWHTDTAGETLVDAARVQRHNSSPASSVFLRLSLTTSSVIISAAWCHLNCKICHTSLARLSHVTIPIVSKLNLVWF